MLATRSKNFRAGLILEQIPKPNETEGLGIGWPMQATDMDKLKALSEDLKAKM